MLRPTANQKAAVADTLPRTLKSLTTTSVCFEDDADRETLVSLVPTSINYGMERTPIHRASTKGSWLELTRYTMYPNVDPRPFLELLVPLYPTVALRELWDQPVSRIKGFDPYEVNNFLVFTGTGVSIPVGILKRVTTPRVLAAIIETKLRENAHGG